MSWGWLHPSLCLLKLQALLSEGLGKGIRAGPTGEFPGHAVPVTALSGMLWFVLNPRLDHWLGARGSAGAELRARRRQQGTAGPGGCIWGLPVQPFGSGGRGEDGGIHVGCGGRLQTAT